MQERTLLERVAALEAEVALLKGQTMRLQEVTAKPDFVTIEREKVERRKRLRTGVRQ